MSTEEREETEGLEEVSEETPPATESTEEGGAAEEYLPTEEEVTVSSTALDDTGLDAMITIGDVLRKAISGEIDINEAVNIINEVRSRLVRKVVRAKSSKRRKRK